MKRVLIICPAIPDDMPYLRHYIDYLESQKVSYDLLYLCRGLCDAKYPTNYISFSCNPSNDSFISKLWHYYMYSRFVINVLHKSKYTHIITFGIASSVFLSIYLSKKYESKYIYDIRDYSKILRIALFKHCNAILLKYSYINVISSNGFRKWLPMCFDYVLCHNTTIKKLEYETSNSVVVDYSDKIKILTIGQIRDLESNTFIIERLGNNSKFELIFSGKGLVLHSLENTVREKGYNNVVFTGRYKKEEEDAIVGGTTFINVCMDNNIVSDYLLSNRLYLAARLKKPLISFEGSYQAEIIQSYSLGVIIKRTDNIPATILEYISTFKSEEFIKGCNDFLDDVKKDLYLFSAKLSDFIENK